MNSIVRVVSVALLLAMLLPRLSRAENSTVADVVPDNVELAVLKQIYDSLGGSAWTTKTNWPAPGSWPATVTSAQFGTWYGITVVNGDIDKISLANNKLAGKLPTTLGNLTALKKLILYNNKITGRIPAQLASLKNSLEEFQISQNQLFGGIPLWMGTMTKLKVLELHTNQLTGVILPSLGNLTSLTSLLLSNNQFKSTIPTSLCNLVNLESLGLSTNQLYGCIPSDIGNLTKLRRVNLSENQLTGLIPVSIGKWTGVDYLNLNKNKLSGPIPREIGLMKALTELYLAENDLTGELRSELGELPRLLFFYANDNELIGEIPENLKNLSTIQRFYVQNNRLEGRLRPDFFNLWTTLELINIANNQLTGDFPSVIAAKDKLKSIAAADNAFRTLPSDIVNLTVLTNLSIQNNELITLPSFVGRTANGLLTLLVQNNQLDFSSLETLKDVGLKAVTFAPQRPIRDITSLTATLGSPIVIPSRPAGTHVTTITWEKRLPNGTWQSVGSGVNQDGTNTTFKRNVYTPSDEGIYRWRMSNDFVTETTLQSEPVTVKTAIRFNLDNFAFQYKYDGRHRVTHKKVPGADWTYIVYDERNLPVMTQTGEQRKRNAWSFTKYDAFRRPIMKGVYYHTALVDQAEMTALIRTGNFFETYTGAVTNHGYSNTLFPATFPVDSFDIQTVTYYDNYDFSAGWGAAYDYKKGLLDDQSVDGYTYEQPDEHWKQVVGQVTGVKVKTSGADPYWLHTINYYDKDYRIIQQIADNYKGGKDRTTTLYDFAGKELTQKTEHQINKLAWQNLVGVELGVDNIKKILFSASWIAGASSTEMIPAGADGWVETTVIGSLSSYRMVGLSDEDVGTHYSTIDYALYMRGAALHIYVAGENVYTVPGNNAIGDKLRIERKENHIAFYRNGIRVYPANPTALPCTTRLLVDISMYTRGGTVNYTGGSMGQSASQTVTRRFVYDHAGRLLETWHTTNDAPEVLLVKNEYNSLGQRITKKLHSSDQGATFKQHEDFRYNIRGWLTRMNQSSLNPENGDDPQDYFGINLAYNDVVSGLDNNPQYNGNISAITWSNGLGLKDAKQNAYRYTYDSLDRIKSADFRQRKDENWGLPEHLDEGGNPQTSDAFTETGYRYDLNGNLQHLTRKGQDGLMLDELKYQYGTGSQQSNRLQHVADGGDKYQGFNDGNTVGDDYAYDNNGNMTSDKNKNIVSITYNDLNLPIKVVKATGECMRYVYDARGRKHCQQVYDAANALTKRSDYIDEMFYENDTLRFINHEEGRIVMTDATPEYQYHLKDHQGNVRVTFTSKDEVETVTATLEDKNTETERGQFLNYDEAVTLNEAMFDHTHHTSGNESNTTFRSARLLGGGNADAMYGLAKSISVMPGDKITAEVYAKYVDHNDPEIQEWLQNFLGSLGSGDGGPLIDGGAPGSIGGAVFPLAGYLQRQNDTGDGPKAYLNYIIFDRDFNYLDGGYKRLTTLGRETGALIPEGGQHEALRFEEGEIKITQPGFVYIYFSNENPTPVEVFFDDFNVTHVKTPVVQIDDYYPFGLTYNSYVREKSALNRWKFQGQEHIDDLDLGWDSFKWRNHQPDIGRFFNIDPLAEKYYYNSAYAFSENKVVAHVELEGLEAIGIEPSDVVAAMAPPQEATGLTSAELKVLNGLQTTGFGVLGTAASTAYIAESGGVGAALGGVTAMTFSIGEITIGITQIVDGLYEMSTGTPSPQSDMIQNVGTIPGLITQGVSPEHAQFVDATAALLPGTLTGGNIAGLVNAPGEVLSSPNLTQAAVNAAEGVDAYMDLVGMGNAIMTEISNSGSSPAAPPGCHTPRSNAPGSHSRAPAPIQWHSISEKEATAITNYIKGL